MEELGDDAKAAIAAIESARLTPTEHDLFIFFVKESVDSSHAARFILRMIDNDAGVSREEVFNRLKRAIKNLLPKCRLLDSLVQPLESIHLTVFFL